MPGAIETPGRGAVRPRARGFAEGFAEGFAAGFAAGFTLVEVMVALAVVALALPALIMTLYHQVDGIEHLRDKSQAQMVAANKLAELRLVSQARQSLPDGAESGSTELAGRPWSWRITTTEQPQMQSYYLVEIVVRPGEDRQQGPALYTLSAYLSGEIESASDNPDTGDPSGGNPNGEIGGGGTGGEGTGGSGQGDGTAGNGNGEGGSGEGGNG